MPAVDIRSGRLEPAQPNATQAHRAFAVVFETHAERTERTQRSQIVVPVGEAAQFAGAVGERGHDQRAVGDASVTRHGHAALQRAMLGSNDQPSGSHGFRAKPLLPRYSGSLSSSWIKAAPSRPTTNAACLPLASACN